MTNEVKKRKNPEKCRGDPGLRGRGLSLVVVEGMGRQGQH